MAREVDPLLPLNDPAPEISPYGTGYSKGSTPNNLEFVVANERPFYNDEEHDLSRQYDTASTRRSILGSIITTITFVAFFIIVAAAVQGGSEPPQPHPQPPGIRPIPGRPSPVPPQPDRTIEQRVKTILTETPLIDGHNDLAIFIRARYSNDINGAKFRHRFEQGGMEAQVDLPRLKKGLVGGAFWSAFVVCPEHASEDFSDEQYASAVAHTVQQIDLIKRLEAQYPSHFSPAGSSLETMLTQFRRHGRMFGQISIEGLHQVSQSAAMSTLRLYHALGVRAATLTWNCHNAFADAALITENGTTKIAPYHRGGLTPAGREVIQEMNRLGLLIDISHTSYWTQKAVLSNHTSRSPVVFTHSSAFALCPHPRNVHDDILHLVQQTNSVVMVNFSPDFISCRGNGVDMPDFYPHNNTLHQVARHIMYIGKLIGFDHVGLGSDFDGIETTPRGLDGVDKYPDLIGELLEMGVSDANASKIAGGNILRVWRDAEMVARQMAEEGVAPGQDQVHGLARDEL